MYTALLFDTDGVILELTEGDRDRLERAVYAAFGEFATVPDDDHVADLIYRVDPDHLCEIAAEYDLDPEAFWAARDRHCSRVQRNAIDEGHVGMYDDVAALHALNRPLGMVSTNQHATIEHVIERFDLPLFETYYGREPTIRSLQRKKPAPYYIDRALSDLGTRDGLYVGDSEHDIVAANRAGLDSAFLRREHNRDVTLSVEPTHELDSLTALQELA